MADRGLSGRERDTVLDDLRAIIRNDSSRPYGYGDRRGSDGLAPKPGARWCTPREIAAELFRALEDGAKPRSLGDVLNQHPDFEIRVPAQPYAASDQAFRVVGHTVNRDGYIVLHVEAIRP